MSPDAYNTYPWLITTQLANGEQLFWRVSQRQFTHSLDNSTGWKCKDDAIEVMNTTVISQYPNAKVLHVLNDILQAKGGTTDNVIQRIVNDQFYYLYLHVTQQGNNEHIIKSLWTENQHCAIPVSDQVTELILSRYKDDSSIRVVVRENE